MAPAEHGKDKPAAMNRLQKATPFVCDVHFRADLPEVPGFPKMLVTPLQPERLAQFKLTSLETSGKRPLILEADLGIPITILDVERFDIPDDPPPLAPEDEALLVGADGLDDRQRKKPAGKQELSWLMRTTYISNEERAKQRQHAEKDAEYSDLLDDEIAAIEAGFAAAAQPPRHLTKPDMQVLEELPVLPDFDNWSNKYILATFDDNPARDYPPLAKALPSAQNMAAAQGLLKSYNLTIQEKQEKMVALMLPKIPLDLDAEEDPFADDRAQEYEWVREYKFRSDHDPDAEGLLNTCVLTVDDDRVTFNPIGSRMVLQRRRRGAIDRPSRITLRKRPWTEKEDEDRAARRVRLDPEQHAQDFGGGDAGGSPRAGSASPSLSD